MKESKRLHNAYLKANYYYLVEETVSTLGKDLGHHGPCQTEAKFFGNDLSKSREEAIEYFEERLKWASNSRYFLPIALPENFVEGENAEYSIVIILVQLNHRCQIQNEYVLYGGDDDAYEEEALKIETLIFKLKNLPQPKPFK